MQYLLRPLSVATSNGLDNHCVSCECSSSAWALVQKNTLLAQVCRGYNFLEGLLIEVISIAALAGLITIIRKKRPA